MNHMKDDEQQNWTVCGIPLDLNIFYIVFSDFRLLTGLLEAPCSSCWGISAAKQWTFENA